MKVAALLLLLSAAPLGAFALEVSRPPEIAPAPYDRLGGLPLLLYWRNDPLHGVRRLFVDPVERSWAPPPVPRRRSARR